MINFIEDYDFWCGLFTHPRRVWATELCDHFWIDNYLFGSHHFYNDNKHYYAKIYFCFETEHFTLRYSLMRPYDFYDNISIRCGKYTETDPKDKVSWYQDDRYINMPLIEFEGHKYVVEAKSFDIFTTKEEADEDLIKLALTLR